MSGPSLVQVAFAPDCTPGKNLRPTPRPADDWLSKNVFIALRTSTHLVVPAVVVSFIDSEASIST